MVNFLSGLSTKLYSWEFFFFFFSIKSSILIKKKRVNKRGP